MTSHEHAVPRGRDLILLVPLAGANGAVLEVAEIGRIGPEDGRLTDAEIDPSGALVLVVGEGGFAERLDGDAPTDADRSLELRGPTSSDLEAVAWHPGGRTALLVGSQGAVWRYAEEDGSLTNVNDSSSVLNVPFTSVDWRRGGDMAYLGTDDGAIYRFSKGPGSTSSIRTQPRPSGPSSAMVARMRVSSSRNPMASASSAGTRGWLGSDTANVPWFDASCPTPSIPTCVAFGSGKRTTMVELDEDVEPIEAWSVYIIDEAEGMFIGASVGSEDLTLVHTAPMGLHIHRFREHAVYPHVAPSAFIEGAATASAGTVIATWGGTGAGVHILTAEGVVLQLQEAMVDIDDAIITTVLLVAVVISVPGAILGLIYMNSPFLQRRYLAWRQRSRGS